MDKLKTIVQTLDNKLGKDIVVLDMSLTSPVCDYFVIVTAGNERLLNSLKENVEEEAMGEVQEAPKVEENNEKAV